MAYRTQVMDHLVSPRNVGEIVDPSGTGESGDAACGDIARFDVSIDENTVETIRYQVYGCAACIAAGSALTELVDGESLLMAAKVSRSDLQDSLGGPLPEGKDHALTLVLDALHKAFEDHWNHESGILLAGYESEAHDG